MSDNNLIYTKTYNKLRKIIDFNELKKTRHIKLKSKGLMDLSVDFLCDVEKGFIISLAHNFEQNGDLMCEYLVQIFGNEEFAAEYYENAFSKKIAFGKTEDGTPILEGYDEKDCVKLTFRVTGLPQDIAIQSIYLPKEMSWINVKEVVRESLKFDPVVTLAFYKNGELDYMTSDIKFSEIVRIFEDATITVMATQRAGGDD